MMKRIISIFISTFLIFTLIFTSVPAIAAQKNGGKCGAKVSYSLNKKTGVLTVSGKGKMDNYDNYWNSGNNSPFEKYSKEIKKVEIKSGVTYIGEYAFCNCEKIKKITLPESVKAFGKYAFSNCRSLAEITLPKKLTVIPEGCFSSCVNLKSVKLPGSVKSIEPGAFSCCWELTSVKLPKGLKHLRFCAFEICGKLKEIKIPKGCIAESCAFECDELDYAEFENGSEIIDDRVFCDGELKSVYIPKSVKVIWINSFNSGTDIYYQGSKKDSEKIDILDSVDYESGWPHYNNEYDSLSKLGKVYYNTSLAVKIPSVKKISKGKSTIKIDVKQQSSANGYELEYRKKYDSSQKTKTTKGNSFTLKKLKKGVKYCYRIRAYKIVKGKKVYSRFSKEKTVKL